MAFAIRHPGQVAPFIRLAFTTDLTLAFLPARYFNVVHANSVFTHCPIEIIEECFAPVGRRLMAPAPAGPSQNLVPGHRQRGRRNIEHLHSTGDPARGARQVRAAPAAGAWLDDLGLIRLGSPRRWPFGW